MSNYKQASRQQAEVCFSFSHSKKNSKELFREGSLTPAEKRGLVGWISAILQPYTQEFVHALDSSESRNIMDLSAYITSNYPHLKDIVRYFIMGFLVDVGWGNLNEETSAKGKQSNDVFLNILIEELANRFYRESQWLTKIMHLPIHQIFTVLDSFAKGYLTLHELTVYSTQQIDFHSPSARLITNKLKNNLGGIVGRIYQENLREVQLRVDLTSFACGQLERGQECAQSYANIYVILSRQGKKTENERMRIEELEFQSSRKNLEQLELSREDYRIRSISKMIVEGHRTPSKSKPVVHQDYNTSNAQYDQNSLPYNSFKPLSQTKADERSKFTLQDIHHSASGQEIQTFHRNDIQHSRKLAEMAIDLQAIHAQQQQVMHHDRLLVRAAILSELQSIKFAKFHNRHHLCSYI